MGSTPNSLLGPSRGRRRYDINQALGTRRFRVIPPRPPFPSSTHAFWPMPPKHLAAKRCQLAIPCGSPRPWICFPRGRNLMIALEARKLTKCYTSVPAVSDVSFSLKWPGSMRISALRRMLRRCYRGTASPTEMRRELPYVEDPMGSCGKTSVTISQSSTIATFSTIRVCSESVELVALPSPLRRLQHFFWEFKFELGIRKFDTDLAGPQAQANATSE